MGASIALLCVPSLSDEFQDGADEEKKLMNRNMQDYKFSACLCGKSLFGEGGLDCLLLNIVSRSCSWCLWSFLFSMG